MRLTTEDFLLYLLWNLLPPQRRPPIGGAKGGGVSCNHIISDWQLHGRWSPHPTRGCSRDPLSSLQSAPQAPSFLPGL